MNAPVAPTSPDTDFEVEIASTGQVIQIPAGQSVLHTLMFEGFDIAYACDEGVCGTCLTRVKSGEVDHRDSYLTPEEQASHKQFMPCCSRARSAKLVLDL
jgi:vanillate O-demethylase ferredoxin subunit